MTLVVCGIEELRPGTMRTVMSDDVPIVVVRTREGGYHAVRGFCAHQGANLGGGRLTFLTSSAAPGSYDLSRDAEILRCPWHSFEYDVVTGRCLTDPRLRLKTYDVDVRDGHVVVEA